MHKVITIGCSLEEDRQELTETCSQVMRTFKFIVVVGLYMSVHDRSSLEETWTILYQNLMWWLGMS
jgi:hypothetical protein